jgi:hypothetical protein
LTLLAHRYQAGPTQAVKNLRAKASESDYAYRKETICCKPAGNNQFGPPMPTLIRLVITLLFLAGLAYAGMIALVAFVQPEPKPVTVRIPSRDFLGGGAPALPGTGNAPARPGAAPPAQPAPTAPAAPAAPAVDPQSPAADIPPE